MSSRGSAAGRLAQARGAFLGTRSRFRAFLSHAAATRVTAKYSGVRWITAVILLLFGTQLLTGTLLSLYYRPDPATAHESTHFIIDGVTAGWLVRSIHAWAADLLLVVVVAHLLAVFLRRAYARPREYQWVVGVFLLVFVIAFRFTGSILPWDEIGHRTTLAGLAALEQVPILGDIAARWLMGGDAFGAKSLGRFYTTHALILPWLVVFLLTIHLYLLRRHGLKGGDR